MVVYTMHQQFAGVVKSISEKSESPFQISIIIWRAYQCTSFFITLHVVTVREVLDRTWPYRANWRFIGIELGMDQYELAAIHHTYIMFGVGECLREMIMKWLSHHDPKPTRLALDEALKSQRVLNITGTILYKWLCISLMCIAY